MPSTPPGVRMALAGTADIPHVAAMRRLEGWSANEWLLHYLATWRRARVLLLWAEGEELADHASRVRGTTVATAYGAVGFIGNVIIDHAARGRGYGKQLMAAAIAWLTAEGAQTVLLDATATGRPLYERFGFMATVHSWAVSQSLSDLRLDDVVLDTGLTFHELEGSEIADVGALDRVAFGGDRLSLLIAMHDLVPARGYAVRAQNGDIEGYLFVRPLDEPGAGLYIGPFVARSQEAARALLVKALRCERAMIPDAELGLVRFALGVPGTSAAALDLYRSLGVRMEADDVRMRLDIAQNTPRSTSLEGQDAALVRAGRAEWLYGMLSTMVG